MTLSIRIAFDGHWYAHAPQPEHSEASTWATRSNRIASLGHDEAQMPHAVQCEPSTTATRRSATFGPAATRAWIAASFCSVACNACFNEANSSAPPVSGVGSSFESPAYLGGGPLGGNTPSRVASLPSRCSPPRLHRPPPLPRRPRPRPCGPMSVLLGLRRLDFGNPPSELLQRLLKEAGLVLQSSYFIFWRGSWAKRNDAKHLAPCPTWQPRRIELMSPTMTAATASPSARPHAPPASRHRIHESGHCVIRAITRTSARHRTCSHWSCSITCWHVESPEAFASLLTAALGCRD